MNDDLISRQAALEFAKDIVFKYPDGTEYKHRCIDPDDVRKLPSAEITEEDIKAYCKPRHLVIIAGEYFEYLKGCYGKPQKRGKWEMKPDPFGFFHDIPVCSECGCTTKMREKTKYCPNCGARMDEE